MRVLEVENLRDRPYIELHGKAWFIALQNSIKDLVDCYPDADNAERDIMYERDNKCSINYRINSTAVRSITFEREEDYTMFILRWS